MAITLLAKVVAIAAPATPHPNPQSYMHIGSRIMLSTTETALITMGVTMSPLAFLAELKAKYKYEKGIPSIIILIYTREYS